MKKFKVGDFVKITRKLNEFEINAIGWDFRMEKMVGSCYLIKSSFTIEGDIFYSVRNDDISFSWPENCLEMVKSVPRPHWGKVNQEYKL